MTKPLPCQALEIGGNTPRGKHLLVSRRRVWKILPRMPQFSIMQSAPGPETVIDGVRYLYFGGTSYLGLAAHPEIIEAGCVALRQYGLHSATTRARFGTIPPVLEVERRAAEFFGTEDAFYFTSGYSANHILVSALAAGVERILVDQSSHFSVLEAARLPGVAITMFRARDAGDLRRNLLGVKHALVMADAVGPADGALAPVDDYLHELEECERALLLLDDAHGFGVLGENGRGLLDESGLWKRVNRSTTAVGISLHVGGTLSKALGGFGGIIPGTREYVAQLRTSSHYFDGASAPPSPVAAATAKALEIVTRESSLRRQLRENTVRLRTDLTRMGLTVPQGAAAHCGVSIGTAANMRRIHEALKGRGVILPYLEAYSGTPAEGLLRFSVFASHTTAQIEFLLDALRAVL